MAFQDYKYEGDDGDIYLVRMDTALKAALSDNTEPSGATTKPWHLETSDSSRSFGIKPRHIIATRSFGSGADTGVKRIKVTIFDPAKIEGEPPDINVGNTFTYRGNTWTVASLVGETDK